MKTLTKVKLPKRNRSNGKAVGGSSDVDVSMCPTCGTVVSFDYWKETREGDGHGRYLKCPDCGRVYKVTYEPV